MEGDAPAAASFRVPVTTNPKRDGKPRKRKTQRLYGATRTESGANLQRASPGRYVQASPGTITAWERATQAYSTQVDPVSGRPVDVDLINPEPERLGVPALHLLRTQRPFASVLQQKRGEIAKVFDP